jgi:hypothetical protein
MRRTHRRHTESDVRQPTWVAPAELGGWSLLVDGARPWGSFDATVTRYGVQRYRLIVYPGGIGTSHRRLARLWRAWPISGAVLILLAVMLLGNVSSFHTLLAAAVAVYLGVCALLFAWAGPARVPVRSMSAILMPGGPDIHERRRYTEWQTLVGMLTLADHMLTTGAISKVEHEATWWEAYDRLGEFAHV